MARKFTSAESNATKINAIFGNSRWFHKALISYNKVTWILFTKFNCTTYRYNCPQKKQFLNIWFLPETSMPYYLHMGLSVAIRNKDNSSSGMLHNWNSPCIIGCLYLFTSCSKESMISSLTSCRTCSFSAAS